MGRSKKPIKVNLKKLVDKVNKNPLNKNLGVKMIDTDVKDINDSFEIQEKTKLKNTNYGPAVVYQDNEKTAPARVRQQMPTGCDGTAYYGEEVIDEKVMTKKDIKKRDEIADAISTKDMKDRYGDNNVKYAIGTKIVMDKKKKKKKEEMKEELDEKDNPFVKKLVKNLKKGS